MTFDTFKHLTDLMVEHSQKIHKCHDLGIDLFDAFDSQEVLIYKLWRQILTEDGVDWFSWFMYEKDYIHDGVGRADLTAHDNGTPICEDLKGLYEYLVKNNYFKIKIEDAKSSN
jgi:hypothetical protein